MKYTYSKMIKDCEKLVKEKGLEVHAVKWLFHSSDLFCGYSHLNDEVDIEVKEKFLSMINRYVNDNVPPQYIINKTFFINLFCHNHAIRCNSKQPSISSSIVLPFIAS